MVCRAQNSVGPIFICAPPKVTSSNTRLMMTMIEVRMTKIEVTVTTVEVMMSTKVVNKANVEVVVTRGHTVALIKFQRGRYARQVINTIAIFL